MEELEVYQMVNILAFGVGILFGAISQKSQFCFAGSIKDAVNKSSTKRISSIVAAMISSILTTAFISSYYGVDLSDTVYLKENINYFAIIIGGALFGIGMIHSDGCSARHMVKFSSGDSYSLIALLFVAIAAFATIKGVLNPIIMPFIQNATLLEISANISNFAINIYFLLVPLFVILFFLVKDDFKRLVSTYDGIIIGILVGVMWYITGYIGSDSFERTISLGSLSFIYSSGQTLKTVIEYNLLNLNYSVILILGIVIGAFCMNLVSKKEKVTCCTTPQTKKLRSKIIGGSLMGVGGVLAIGCTIGQGLTGLSTLAFASFVSISSILVSAYVSVLFLKRKSRKN